MSAARGGDDKKYGALAAERDGKDDNDNTNYSAAEPQLIDGNNE